jgi:hypothetical protein
VLGPVLELGLGKERVWVRFRDRVKVRFRVTCISLKWSFCFDLSSLGWEGKGGEGGGEG